MANGQFGFGRAPGQFGKLGPPPNDDGTFGGFGFGDFGPFKPPATVKPPKLAPPPTITAPTVETPQIDLPSGTIDELRKSQFEAQFLPVQQQIQRQAGKADEALAARLAESGLSESGTGIGQRVQQSADFANQETQAAQVSSAQASARALEAQIAIETQNAGLQMQANLANANFDLTAQQANAANILATGQANNQAYLAALGINAQMASQFRSDFLSFFTAKEQASIARDELKLKANAQVFNQYLQQQALSQKKRQFEEEVRLAMEELGLKEAQGFQSQGMSPNLASFRNPKSPGEAIVNLFSPTTRTVARPEPFSFGGL